MHKKQLRVRSIRRKQIDEDKLAMAYLLLAKAIVEQPRKDESTTPEKEAPDEQEARS